MRYKNVVGYTGVHYRANKLLPLVCAHADETCKGLADIAEWT